MTKPCVNLVATLAITTLAVACGQSNGTASPTVAATETTAASAGTDASSSTSPVDSATQTTAPNTQPATVPTVTVDVTGTAVAGNSGGVGKDQTQTLSESIRNEDGSCSGWEGPGDAGLWTQGLEKGAPVAILDGGSGEQIGSGSITSSAWTDVDPSDDRDQWDCAFVFEGTVNRETNSLKIKVADLQPWVARPDPTNPGKFVASVDTKIELSRVSACTDRVAGDPIFEWSSVGEFWADGFGSICGGGLIIDHINRLCRPPTIGSEYVIAVRSAADQSVIYEDSDGLHVDPSTLAPDTKVVVDVATGRPC